LSKGFIIQHIVGFIVGVTVTDVGFTVGVVVINVGLIVGVVE